MPAKSRWLLHIPEIVSVLSALDVPIVDRRVIEELFGVKRRQSITLMQHFGGYRSGNAVLVDRAALIEQLNAVQSGEAFEEELARKQKLYTHLDRIERQRAAARVRIPVPPDIQDRDMQHLPEGIALDWKRLTIDFNGGEQLLGKLYELSQAVASDYNGFCRMVEPRADNSGSCPKVPGGKL